MAGSAFLFDIRLDGESTRILLRRRKITQRRAAQFLKVSPPQLVQYLNGKYSVPHARFKRLLKILQITEKPELILRTEGDSHA